MDFQFLQTTKRQAFSNGKKNNEKLPKEIFLLHLIRVNVTAGRTSIGLC